ncbi:uncharacterized protein LOC116158740 [Photinus pyralis]|uniref:uncharacterized protein LOC116158740 n=1 Tax=Photinus pyralis TaxID=7054 RepID=UPI0012675AE2|nr:uncharacterized protein LOC116158740 [Photinus pyralis]
MVSKRRQPINSWIFLSTINKLALLNMQSMQCLIARIFAMRIAHVNIRSLVPKLHVLKSFLDVEKYDVMAISESWLKNDVSDEHITIPGYNLVRHDRVNRGSNQYTIEHLWLNIKTSTQSVVVGVIYRPPNQNYKVFCDELEGVCLEALLACESLVCVGDVNINILNKSSTETKYYLNMLETLGLTQIIEKATRLGTSLLDHIIVSNPIVVKKSGTNGMLFADHETIFCELVLDKIISHHERRAIRSFKNFDVDLFRADVQRVAWQHIFYIADVNLKLNYLNDNILNIINKHAPIVTVSGNRKTNTQWLSSNTKYLMRLRDKAYKKFKQSQSPAHWEYYKSLRNFVNKTVKLEKKAFLEYKLNNKDPKVLWKELKNLKIVHDRKNVIPPFLQHANQINDYFINSIPAVQSDLSKIEPLFSADYKYVNFEFSSIDTGMAAKLLNSIKTNSTGWDGINITIVKLFCPTILPYLTHIINECINTNTFPTAWKKHLSYRLQKYPTQKNTKIFVPSVFSQ